MVERIGLDHAKQLWALSEQGLDYVRRTIDETGMPGVDPVPGWLHVSKTDNADEIARRGRAAALDRRQCRSLADASACARCCRTSAISARCIFPARFHIHPLNYALGLAADAEKAGARIFEDTPAIAIDPAGVRKRIDTPERARARGACGARRQCAARRLDAAARARRCCRSPPIVLVTEPIGRVCSEVVRYRGAVSDTNRADNHYRIVGGDRDCSGPGACGPGRPIRAGSRRGLVADIRRNFPALGKVEIAHLWRGTLGRAIHRMPQIGEIESGLWVASGFGGHGLNTTAMGGELIARGIVENDQTWRLFAPYELVWAGGVLGRALAQGIYWGSAADRADRAGPVALSRADAHAQSGAACGAQWACGRARCACAGRAPLRRSDEPPAAPPA